jgi:hypothetical protein
LISRVGVDGTCGQFWFQAPIVLLRRNHLESVILTVISHALREAGFRFERIQ